jgi:hypothetical protein|tara:strand:- start:1563 stop:1877 length:315 start_codon:yes stop_codon:yes gene_type:complete
MWGVFYISGLMRSFTDADVADQVIILLLSLGRYHPGVGVSSKPERSCLMGVMLPEHLGQPEASRALISDGGIWHYTALFFSFPIVAGILPANSRQDIPCKRLPP